MANRPLVPLRIPSSWLMVFNNFVEFSDGEMPSEKDLDFYLTQDILAIRKVTHRDGVWNATQDGIGIYLGWYPDMDPSGSYCLEITSGEGNLPIAEFTDRRSSAVREAINICLRLAALDAGKDEFIRNMEELTERFSSEADAGPEGN